MMPQDIANNQLPVGFQRHCHYFFRVACRGGQWFFNKHVSASFHRGNGKSGMAVGIGAYRHKIRPGGIERRGEFCEHRVALQGFGQGHDAAVDQADNLEFRVCMIGKGMCAPHIPQTCNHYPDHFTAPDVMPRINCLEKMT